MSDLSKRAQYPQGYWDDKFEYLRQARTLQHNDDYLEFLVTRIWKLDRPCRVVDFGCGYGRFGTMLLPLLPGGSTYTGVDQSSELIARARQVYAAMPYPSEFFEGGVYQVPFDDSTFDLAMSHTVLMHIPQPKKAIQEMIRVTRHNGLIITCDTSRNAHAALFHIDETNEQETRPLGLTQTINRAVREQTGVDYNIGLKTPILMHRAGLKNVGARISDSVRLLFPPVDTDEKERLFRALCDEGYGVPAPDEQGRAGWKANLVRLGVSEQEAEKEIERILQVNFIDRGREYHTVYTGVLTFSFGTVNKTD